MAAVPIAAWVRVLIQLSAAGFAYWDTHGGMGGFDRFDSVDALHFKRAVIHFQRYRSVAAGDLEDMQIVTHWLNYTGDAWDSTWTTADYQSVEAAVLAWWTTLRPGYTANTGLHGITWYDGTLEAGVVGDAERIHLFGTTPYWNVFGSASASTALPPQVANVVTLRVHPSGHWGRMYVPAPSNTACDPYGRFAAASSLAAASRDLVIAGHANGIAQVVYSRTQAALLTPYAVSVDDTFDTIRRRRYDSWNVRVIQPVPA